MNLKNKILPNPNGKGLCFLAGKPIEDGVRFTTVHLINVIYLKEHLNQVLENKNASLILSAKNAVIMRHGQKAVTTEESSLNFIETVVS